MFLSLKLIYHSFFLLCIFITTACREVPKAIVLSSSSISIQALIPFIVIMF